MFSPVENGAILGTIICAALFVWNLATLATQHSHWPNWTALAMTLGVIGAVIAASLIVSLRVELRARRERRKRAAMEQRYPNAMSPDFRGKWFLTDKATGREFRINHDHR
ncbi:hypothetical protein [Paraburkholderia largidicola]|uniref:Uncharacterized protein n=1 Tax=Paraburkholderia largidicola TaxID=3014751 RepID=A0A7I8C2B3_9BURK|nr:hypothetical protein [Paraburkholderia sp. PGU16]BCF95182.1 hypothetical protein PPGU16_82490 [Paraburkholderia sp. PGU16]